MILHWKSGFSLFIKKCKAKKLENNTIRQYNQAYERFTNCISPDKLISDISKNDIENFILYLKNFNPQIRNTTINTYLRPIRTLLYDFMENEYIQKKFKIRLLNERKIPKVIYTDNELIKLLKKPNLKKCTFTEYRNWVLINYFLATR